MNNVRHTGGPWVADERSIRRLLGTIPSVIIATVEGPPDVAEANARLIAAAPDMLAALNGVLDPSDIECPDDLRPEWKAVVAAIAKAEGRTE